MAVTPLIIRGKCVVVRAVKDENDGNDKNRRNDRNVRSHVKNECLNGVDCSDEEDSMNVAEKSRKMKSLSGRKEFRRKEKEKRKIVIKKEKSIEKIVTRLKRSCEETREKRTRSKTNSFGKENDEEKTVDETPRPRSPYNLRRRNQLKIAAVTEEQELQIQPESDDSESDDKEDENISGEVGFEYVNSDDEKTGMSENYFRAHIGKAVSSNHTLSRLRLPRLDSQTLESASKKVSNSHEKHIEALINRHKSCYRKWMFQLSEGFNLLFYGFGSKRQLLLDFKERMLQNDDSLVINGFFTNLTMKDIFRTIIEDIFNGSCSANLQNMLNTINYLMEKNSRNLYLIIHNIDGVMLRSEKAQNVLSQLAKINHVKILASIDHINAPLIWDQNKLNSFNWIWHDISTFASYTNETTFATTILGRPTSSLMLSSLVHVFRSLNPKAKKIFLLLAQYQLDNKDNSSYIGMPYQDCYHKCRENFLVNSDLTMKTQLTEFKDHKLIKLRKGHDSVEHLFIPLEVHILAEFVQQHK